MTQKIMAPISVGELWDKITILKIKQQHVQPGSASQNILHELQQLQEVVPAQTHPHILDLVQQLTLVNKTIWHAEEQIRLLYAQKQFDDQFCNWAQVILRNNDHRAHIKRQINALSGSLIWEEKIYLKMAHEGLGT